MLRLFEFNARWLTCLVFGGVLLATSLLFAADPTEHNFKPKDGYVPNAKTAIKIAVAVWEPIYGEKLIAGEKPYVAELINGIWIVQGSLQKNTLGGDAIAEIAKDDGRILRVSHGQ
jgi:hypothetical protein